MISGSEFDFSATAAQRTGGWGQQFNFSVEVRDRFSRNVSIYAWQKKGAEDYTLINSTICENCGPGFNKINFTRRYNGSDITAAGGWTFKINATNADGNASLDGFTYTVEKDDINTDYISPANETNINRSATTVLSVRSYDRDLGAYPNGTSEAIGKIYISVFNINSFESSPSTISADS